MNYPNTREGRNQILDEIARLQEMGYSREDKRNESVTLEKVVRKGKICREIEVVRFIFNPSERVIISNTEKSHTGLDKARSMLLGWTSPSKDVSNAVKAGLLDENDKQILKSTIFASNWNNN